MALVQCPDCGVDVSSKAERCAQCGFPMRDAPINIAERQRRASEAKSEQERSHFGTFIVVVTLLAGFAIMPFLPDEGPMEWPIRTVVLVVFLWLMYQGYKRWK